MLCEGITIWVSKGHEYINGVLKEMSQALARKQTLRMR